MGVPEVAQFSDCSNPFWWYFSRYRFHRPLAYAVGLDRMLSAL